LQNATIFLTFSKIICILQVNGARWPDKPKTGGRYDGKISGTLDPAGGGLYLSLPLSAREGQRALFFGRGGGFGTVMLVDYESSTAGPYSELLFSPGKFSFNGKKYNSITKIYVSSMESVVNGRENWGIPKELADFTFTDLGGRRRRITVEKNGETVVDMVVSKGGPGFPVSTALLPLPLCQKLDGRFYFTRFRGKGKGRFSRIESIIVNPDRFPEIEDDDPLVGIGVEDFTIEFPVARIVSAGQRADG